MRNAVTVSLIALLLTACMVGPDYSRPSVDIPSAWRVSDQDAKRLANLTWWEAFNDPVLNQLVTDALHENKDLQIASARMEEYAARYGVSRADLFPQVGAGADAYRQKNTLPGTNLKGRYNTYDAFLSAIWEIDLWGRIRRQNEAARAQLLASEHGRRGVVLSLISNVVSAYINLRDLDRQLEIAIVTAKTREASYKVFQYRFDGGIISLAELSQNKSQYEEALATIPVLEKAIAQQENALSVLLGRNPGPIKRGKTIDELSMPDVPGGLPSGLLARRPDILESEQNLVAANALIGVAKAAYFPSISLTGTTGVASSDLSNLFDSTSGIWQYGARVNLPVFTAGKIASQVRVAEAQQQQALLAYQRSIQNAFREVNDALIDQEQTRAQLATQRSQVESLQQYAQMANLRYDNGYTSYIEVLDAERSLFNAQLQTTKTQQALFQSMINLYKAMGGGWPEEGTQAN